SNTLAVTAGAEDELPEGPNAFAVMPDGGFAVSDPVRKRIALFDAKGGYKGQVGTGFAVDRLSADARGGLTAHAARSDVWHRFDTQGRPAGGLGEPPPQPPEAKLAGANQAVVNGPDGRPITLRFEGEGGSRLASVENLG